MSGSVAHRLEYRDREAALSLSAREIEVLQEVAHGKSNRQIGADLFLSEATVKSHLVHIYNKMGCGPGRLRLQLHGTPEFCDPPLGVTAITAIAAVTAVTGTTGPSPCVPG